MVLVFEILGVFLMAMAWMVAIVRMIETRRWSPMRPAVMAIVMTGCLLLMGQTLIDYAQTGELRSTFYLAAWNLGMALFDCKIALVLARRGDFSTTRRRSLAGFNLHPTPVSVSPDTVVIPPVAKEARTEQDQGPREVRPVPATGVQAA